MESTLFDIELHYIIKFFVVCYALLFILFLSKVSTKIKIIYLIFILSLFSYILFENNSINKLINYIYYLNTYSFLLSYYYNNSIKKYKIINLSTLLLILLDIFLLISGNCSFTFELIVNILLPISFVYYESNNKLSILIVTLSLLVALLNNMNLILYNLLIISFILIYYSFKKNNNKILSFLILISVIVISLFNNVFDVKLLLDSFSNFDLSINFYAIITIIPLIILLIRILYKIIKNKKMSFGIMIYLYILIMITTFAILSIKNIENEFIILIYSYLFVLELRSLYLKSKMIDDSVTIIALHLGYGGIEQYISSLTKMINKNIRIISTYKLYNVPPFEYDANIEYLMECGPNTKKIKDALKNKNVIKIFIEGVKSINILYLKKYENIEKIEEINSKYIITTREIHNELVGFYGKSDIVKIATEHNYHNNNKRYINRLINSVNNLDYFVLVSKYLKDYYEDKVKIKTIYIPNVIEKIPKEKKTNYGHNLISIGRLNKIKAQDELVELVSILKKEYSDIHLTLIGDGEEKENLELLIKEKKLTSNIRITGFLNKKEIAKELINNNVFVTTSKSESFGLVALDAASFHLPVVAFDSALGLKEILNNNNGILVKNRNLKEMSKEIKKLFDDKKYRDKIGENGYLNAQNYLLSNVEKMWKEIID